MKHILMLIILRKTIKIDLILDRSEVITAVVYGRLEAVVYFLCVK